MDRREYISCKSRINTTPNRKNQYFVYGIRAVSLTMSILASTTFTVHRLGVINLRSSGVRHPVSNNDQIEFEFLDFLD